MTPRGPPAAMIRPSSSSLVRPTRIRQPSWVRMSSSSILSTVLPAITECTPQELLPIIPPTVQYWWVAGSGAKVRPCCSAAWSRSSRIIPGSTRASPSTALSERSRFRRLENSITTVTLRWPRRRRWIRGPQCQSAAGDRSRDRLHIAREPVSNRTSPSMRVRSAAARSAAGSFARTGAVVML